MSKPLFKEKMPGVTISFPKPLLKQLRVDAKARGISVAALVREIVTKSR